MEDISLAARTANKSAVPNDSPDDSTNVFLVSLAMNGALAVIMLSLFSYLRPRCKQLYAPRLLLLDTASPLVQLSDSIFAWLIPARMAKDENIFSNAGMDAFVYIRFMKLCFKISVIILPYGIAVLLPLNLHGGNRVTQLHGLDTLTMSNLQEKSPKVWAHLVAVWAYTLIICYLLYEEWKVYVIYRQEFLAKGLRHQYAVFVSDLPSKLTDAENLRKYVEDLFPAQVEDVIVVHDLKAWEKLIKQHDILVLKLDKARHYLLKKGKRPTHRPKLCGEECDSIAVYENNLEKLQVLLEDEIRQQHPSLPRAFVVFKSLKSASVAAQALWDMNALKTDVKPAPDDKDVIWENLSIGLIARACRTFIVWAAVFALVFFWTIPTGFVSSLIAMDNLKLIFPSLDFSEHPSFLKSLIKGFLSSIVLWLFYLILPWILQFLTKREGIVSRTEVDQSVLGRLFIFKAVNQFLFLAIAGSALNKLDEMISAPKKIPSFLASTLPAQSTFFISFIMLTTFTGYGLEILRLVPLILTPIKRCLAQTPREERAAWEPPRVSYDELYADHLFVFMIGLSYSILAPLVTPFVLLYFGLGYVVWTYQVICVYIPTYNSGGQLWPVVFTRLIAGLVIFHLLMMGMFGLMKIIIIPLLVLPLPAITIAFYFFMQHYYYNSSTFLAQEMASSLSEGSPTVLQDASECYTRNYKLPSLYALSTGDTDLGLHEQEEQHLEQNDIDEHTPLTALSSSGE